MDEYMNKRILTNKQLRDEQLSFAKRVFLYVALISVAFACSVLLVLEFGHRVFSLLFVVLMLGTGFLLAVFLKNGIVLLIGLRQPPIVVVATRVESCNHHLSVFIWLTTIHPLRQNLIHFHGFGSYPYDMYAHGSEPGDKFYLLLSKSGEILGCYPCADYEYEGELTKNPYER